MRTADVERIRNALIAADERIAADLEQLDDGEGSEQTAYALDDVRTDIAAAFGELSVLIDERDALKARVALLEARIPAAQP